MPTYQDLNSAELRDWIFFLRDSRRRGGTALARQMIHRRLTLATERQGLRHRLGKKMLVSSAREVQ